MMIVIQLTASARLIMSLETIAVTKTHIQNADGLQCISTQLEAFNIKFKNPIWKKNA